jgi:hypothetical protein
MLNRYRVYTKNSSSGQRTPKDECPVLMASKHLYDPESQCWRFYRHNPVLYEDVEIAMYPREEVASIQVLGPEDEGGVLDQAQQAVSDAP